MKALVLAGGAGTRLRPLSYSLPKQLIPVANKPVLQHIVESIRDLGVTEIGIVVGARDTALADAMGDGSRYGVAFTWIPQDRPLGLAHAVRIARPYLGDSDFLMYLGDNMLPDGVAGPAAEFRARRPAAQLVVSRVADPREFGVAELDGEGRVVRLAEKPRQPRSDLALTGVYFFTPAIHRAVENVTPSARGELEITDAIQLLIEEGLTVRAGHYRGYWKDTGRAEDVLDCNRHLLRSLRPRLAGHIGEECEISGAVVIEEGARVLRSRITGPVVIGAGTVVEDSHIGPDTCVASHCTLRDVQLSDSIVLDGATLSGVRGLYGSVIGRHALVTSGEGTERHRLLVGDHTRIEVAA
ncbi:glucose-1-phosphate thymidylyltransferase [Streptomyces sp. NPDC057137]|uniref:glucose-1-phosphate thymidylyltransferase n=1 Tax=Streptomyces sp. NPDC057137 TaxID=3346030 RepID=UPI00362B0B5A